MDIKRVKSNLIPKVCKYCDRVFQAERDSARYCSGSCRTNAWKERQKPKIGRPVGSYDTKPRKRQIKVVPEIDHKPPGIVRKPPEIVRKLVDFTEHTFIELNRAIEEKDDYRGGYYQANYIEETLRNEGVIPVPDKFSTGKYSFERTSKIFFICIEEREDWLGRNLKSFGDHT